MSEGGERPYATVQQAADRLGVSPITIRRMVRSRRLPSARVNGRILIRRSALEGAAQERKPQIASLGDESDLVQIGVSDLADQMGTTRRTVERLISDGRLNAVLHGGEVILPRDEYARVEYISPSSGSIPPGWVDRAKVAEVLDLSLRGLQRRLQVLGIESQRFGGVMAIRKEDADRLRSRPKGAKG